MCTFFLQVLDRWRDRRKLLVRFLESWEPSRITDELTVIKSSLKDEYQYSFWDLFRLKTTWGPGIMIGLTLVFCTDHWPVKNILFYASTVLKSVGFQSNEAASLASTGVGVAKVISTGSQPHFSDQVGSKTSGVSHVPLWWQLRWWPWASWPQHPHELHQYLQKP